MSAKLRSEIIDKHEKVSTLIEINTLDQLQTLTRTRIVQ